MLLGALWLPLERSAEVAAELRAIKSRHGIKDWVEVKWQRVAPSQLALYLDLVDYFFDTPDLHFRGVIVPDKRILDHERFGQDHDTWYYKMYYVMLKPVVERGAAFRVYLDIKDTRSGAKVEHLRSVLCKSLHDPEAVQRLQTVRSHEVVALQLADLLIGAVGYRNRADGTSSAKWEVVRRIEERSGVDLTSKTLRGRDKFDLLVWGGQESQQ
jgi:hypothetical protein